MSIGPPLELEPLELEPPLVVDEEPPHAAAATPIPSATIAANAIRAAARSLPCLPSARPNGRLTGLEKRVPIKEFLPFSISLVYKRPGRVADAAECNRESPRLV